VILSQGRAFFHLLQAPTCADSAFLRFSFFQVLTGRANCEKISPARGIANGFRRANRDLKEQASQ
jgi:hypothetical protein